ncbi:MAG: aspartyl/asparaginyl beta-hydroxylase domain-containing protein [Chitinophagaceae bacterium]|nr:aspartyl/asparaginyl beta-hydroxylase domain-containing protein [Chitinophagaceae bacterium]
MQEGECWYMNFNLLHAINNNSSVNRVHLVIDALVNDWVKEIFRVLTANKKEIENTTGRYDTATKKQMIIS